MTQQHWTRMMPANMKQSRFNLKLSCWKGMWRKWRQSSRSKAFFFIFGNRQYRPQWWLFRLQAGEVLLYALWMMLFQSIPSHIIDISRVWWTGWKPPTNGWKWGQSVAHRLSLRCGGAGRKDIKKYISTWKTSSSAHSGGIGPVPGAVVWHDLSKDAANTLALSSFDCKKRFRRVHKLLASANFCRVDMTDASLKIIQHKNMQLCTETSGLSDELCPRVTGILLLFFLP